MYETIFFFSLSFTFSFTLEIQKSTFFLLLFDPFMNLSIKQSFPRGNYKSLTDFILF